MNKRAHSIELKLETLSLLLYQPNQTVKFQAIMIIVWFLSLHNTQQKERFCSKDIQNSFSSKTTVK